MKNRRIKLKENEVEVVDGKVVISSDELANAITSIDVNVDENEENNFLDFILNGKC